MSYTLKYTLEGVADLMPNSEAAKELETDYSPKKSRRILVAEAFKNLKSNYSHDPFNFAGVLEAHLGWSDTLTKLFFNREEINVRELPTILLIITALEAAKYKLHGSWLTLTGDIYSSSDHYHTSKKPAKYELRVRDIDQKFPAWVLQQIVYRLVSEEAKKKAPRQPWQPASLHPHYAPPLSVVTNLTETVELLGKFSDIRGYLLQMNMETRHEPNYFVCALTVNTSTEDAENCTFQFSTKEFGHAEPSATPSLAIIKSLLVWKFGEVIDSVALPELGNWANQLVCYLEQAESE